MTIQRVIENVKRMRSGYDITDVTIIELINRVEQDIYRSIMLGREKAPEIELYEIDTPRETELLAPKGYDGIYQEYVCSMIDLEYEDVQRYSNAAAAYTASFEALKNFWFRTHRQDNDYKYHW